MSDAPMTFTFTDDWMESDSEDDVVEEQTTVESPADESTVRVHDAVTVVDKAENDNYLEPPSAGVEENADVDDADLDDDHAGDIDDEATDVENNDVVQNSTDVKRVVFNFSTSNVNTTNVTADLQSSAITTTSLESADVAHQMDTAVTDIDTTMIKVKLEPPAYSDDMIESYAGDAIEAKLPPADRSNDKAGDDTDNDDIDNNDDEMSTSDINKLISYSPDATTDVTTAENADITTPPTAKPDKKPCVCNICGKSVATPAGLRIHQSRVHKTTTEQETTSASEISTPATHKKVKAQRKRPSSSVKRVRKRPHDSLRDVTSENGDLELPLTSNFTPLGDAGDDVKVPMTSEAADITSSAGAAAGDSGENSAVVKKRRKRSEVKEIAQCSVCNKVFKHQSKLRRHAVVHTGERPYKCDICQRSFSQRADIKAHKLKVHSGPSEKKLFPCDKCAKIYSSEWLLKAHLLWHSGEQPIVCPDCGKSFQTPYGLKQHAVVHSGEKTFACDQCDKRYYRAGELKQHQMSHDETGELPHLCNICGKGFKYTHYLTKHLFLHSGVKPFRCEKCDKAFATRDRLQQHQLSHARTELRKAHPGDVTACVVVKPLVCSECGKCCDGNIKLKRHMRTHSEERPHKCKHCPKAFKTRGNLNLHLERHAGVKNHECDVCGKAFIAAKELHAHMSIHTGEGAHKCEWCSKTFLYASMLKRHALTHERKQEALKYSSDFQHQIL